MNNKVVVLLLSLIAGVPARAFDLGSLTEGVKKGLRLGGPEVELNIEHPPTIPLKVATVAIGKPEGQCSDGVATRVEEDFVQAGITVIDRQRLADVLTEHKLQVSALFDQKTATKVGALLGAQALVFIKVLDCRTGQSQQKLFTDKEQGTVYQYIVQGTINGSLRVVDLTSGKVLAAQRFEGTGRLESNQGFPDPLLALSDAEKTSAFSIHKLLLPWKETKRVVFYGDSQCDMKTASSLLKAQDIEGALKQSESNLAACREQPKVKPATLARAYYNLGILQFVRDDHDNALVNLTEAQKLQSSQVFINAIADCKRAKELAAAVDKYKDDREALAQAQDAKDSSGPAAKKTGASAPGSAKKPAASPSGTTSIESRLAQIEDLLKKKIITQDEYNQKRAKILGEI